MALTQLRVDNVGSVAHVAGEMDPYDTRLQEACVDYIKSNLDIILAARALEEMPADVLAMLDEQLNPEEEIPKMTKSKPKKVRGSKSKQL